MTRRDGAPAPLPPGVPEAVGRLAMSFARLPGVGEKTALRFAFAMATANDRTSTGPAQQLAHALGELVNIVPCGMCGGLGEVRAAGPPLCPICRSGKRDASVLCVVARVQDLLAIERSSVYQGMYFVLGRLISPLEGIEATDLPLDHLRRRLDQEPPSEVLLALPHSVEGDATTLLLAREFGSYKLRVTQLAAGLSHGAELEYADPVTLKRAFDARRNVGR